MSKRLLLSHIKGLIIVLKSSTDYIIYSVYCKLSFCSKIKTYALKVSKVLDLLFFSAVKEVGFPQLRSFSTVKEFFPNQIIFSQSRKFSTVMEILCNQLTFPQSMNFSTAVEIFQNQGSFPK